MIHCLHCGAETTNGLALCDLCQRKTATDLEFLPIYFRNLARWRPGHAGSRPVPGSRVLYDGTPTGLGTGDRISDTLDEVVTELTTWARALSGDRAFVRPLTLTDAVLADDLAIEIAHELVHDQPRAVSLLSAGFTDHLTSMATLDWCGEFVRQLAETEELLRRLTERLVPGWYAGACRCGASTYVVPGLTWVSCGGCGAITHAPDHLETILDEARGWVAHPRRLAEAVVALVDSELSVPRLYDRIRKWSERERLIVHRYLDVDGDEVGPKRYRLGEVLDVLRSEGQTRTAARVDAKVS